VDAVNDFTQEVLVLLVEALQSGSVREPEAMGGYVLGICRNLTLDRVRQRKRREELWSIYSPDLTPVELPLESAAPGEVLKLEVARVNSRDARAM
jgi:DNA-directed RNA polymerase specialized sigma24 family protein